jgi:EAL domain-containing protein (putative c-di-GMP-specific phosphodiesterase class I)
MLHKHARDVAQGYLWSPPVSADDLVHLLGRDRSRAAALS